MKRVVGDDDERSEGVRPEVTELIAQVNLAMQNAAVPSHRKLARLTNGKLSYSTISRMLRGDKLPKLTNLLTVLRALGIPEEQLPEWRRLWSRAANEPVGATTGIGNDVPLPGPRQPTSVASLCAVCGAVVGEAAIHRNWHRQLGRVTGTGRRATSPSTAIAVNAAAKAFPR